jgi:hypothetical protein
MRFAHLTRVPLLCAAASLGCTDSHQRITAPAEVDVARDGARRPSDRSGAIVIKDFAVWSVLGGGPPTNLGLTVAGEASIEDACADPNSIPISPQNGIIVITPSGQLPAHSLTREAFVQVFEYSAGILTHPCQLVGAPLLATGRAFVVQTFNQSAGPGSGPGSFVVHITVHGSVELTGGGQARLHGEAQVVIRPDGTLVIDREPVTLTPV